MQTVSKTTDAVPADARIQDKKCMVFAGTVVSNGRALALVTATAQRTEIGRIQEGVTAAKQDEEKTPLAQKLDNFGNKLTLGIGAICTPRRSKTYTPAPVGRSGDAGP